jgi:glycosyltransferase involved in cell wall biosynthesis
MTGLRLAFVTRRFWPFVGENELLIATLAAELRLRGHRPTVITPKYSKYWPSDVCIREVPVVRLPHPSPRSWGNVRYSFAVSRWIQQHQNDLDAVLVSGPSDDALTVLSALRSTRVATILQEEIGLEIDAPPRRFGEQLQRRLTSCDAFVQFRGGVRPSTNLPTYFSCEKSREIHLGVELPLAYTPVARAAARESLAQINHDLAVSPSAPVALCLAPFVPQAQLEQVARAWRAIDAHWPEARLWIVGDGPCRGPLFELVSDLNLKYRAVLPGTFDDWEMLLQAADVLLQPAHTTLPSLAQLQAMAVGLPVVEYNSARSPTALGRDALPNDDDPVVRVRTSDREQLPSTLTKLFENPRIAASLGERGRRYVSQHHGLNAMLDAYEQMLCTVVSLRRG